MMAINTLVAALATAAVSSRLDLALIIVSVAVVVVVMLVLVMINVVIDKIVCADDDRRTKRFIGIIRAFPWPIDLHEEVRTRRSQEVPAEEGVTGACDQESDDTAD
jgi:hypothetical protein